jgi:RNA polymerase sigma factor (sigma-70 family)
VRRDPADLLLAGDRETIARIRTRIEAVMRRFVVPGGGSRADLVQEALGRVYLGVATGRYRADASLETYAEQTAKHVCLECVRRRRLLSALTGDDYESEARWADPQRSLLLDEEHREALDVLATLSEETLDMLRMIFVERLPYRQVACRLRISEGALRVRIHRCRSACWKQLGRTAKRRGAAGEGRR